MFFLGCEVRVSNGVVGFFFLFCANGVSKIVLFQGQCMANQNDVHNKTKDVQDSLSEENKENPKGLVTLMVL